MYKIDARYHHEQKYIRSLAKQRLGEYLHSNNTIVIPYTPARADYQHLLFPITQKLSDQGVDVTVCVWAADCNDAFDPNKFPDATILYYDSFFDNSAYLKAKRRYRRIETTLDHLFNWIELNKYQRKRTKSFYKQYSVDWVLFERILEATSPKILFNIHYVSNPGFVKAISVFQENNDLFNIIIQHGVFANHPFHPHRRGDADISILWGTHFENQLRNHSVVPPTPMKVMGNPKLEKIRSEHNFAEDSKGLLFVSTCSRPSYNRDALNLFADSVNKMDIEAVLYKPHPTEKKLSNYSQLLKSGDISLDQIVTNDSLYKLISDSRIIVGTHSTALIEAIFLNRVAIQLLPEQSGNKWAEMGMMNFASKSGLKTAISELLTDEEVYSDVLANEQILKQQMFENTSHTDDRIAEYIQGHIPP
jgi:hypothetical protein